MTATRSTDPALDADYLLGAEAKVAFERDGFVKLSGVLPAAVVKHYGAEITRLTLDLNAETRPLAVRDTYDRAFLQVMNLWRDEEAIRPFVFSRRLARIAAELLGVKGVRLYHDQALYKEPGGGITPAHADQYYWPLASDRVVTAWIPLQDVPLDMGPLAFFRGSHHEAFGRDLAISDESERVISEAMLARGFELAEDSFALGDVSFHAGWTFHRAGENRSQSPRSVMTMIYMDRDMRVAEPVNAMQQSDLAQWLPGLGPGDAAASPLNPLLWDRTPINLGEMN